MAAPDPIAPDTKDWTWVLERPCPECGFDPAAHSLASLPGLLHDSAMTWSSVLGRADAARRPAPDVWSALEYACHVRDVHRLFAERVVLMLEQDAPRFANWDQDETAIASGYARQDPATVDAELVEAAGHAAGVYASVAAEQAGRCGTRSDGSEFTVETLGLYHLHDVLHHGHDVGTS
ncbi:DinB family protein [Nocardioides sp. P5_C9_2]